MAYATFTGKAAEVLRKKGNRSATTLHKLLYTSYPKPEGGYGHKLERRSNYDIIVVDEVSMVPKTMINILNRLGAYIIYLGDPFQLPQIDKEDAHDLLAHPHIFLDEVMRQAAESEIIRLSMDIRNNRPIKYGKGSEVIVMRPEEVVKGCYTWADQIICATNKTRQFINEEVRQIYGYKGNPKNGEKMICLHNYWDNFSSDGNALVNGTTGIITNVSESIKRIPRSIKGCSIYEFETINCSFRTEDDSYFTDLSLDKKMVLTGEKCLDWNTSYKLSSNSYKFLEPMEFTFGYCITGHKSQGSQWPKVMVIEEKFPFDKLEHARWLYTVCTRPEEKLLLVR